MVFAIVDADILINMLSFALQKTRYFYNVGEGIEMGPYSTKNEIAKTFGMKMKEIEPEALTKFYDVLDIPAYSLIEKKCNYMLRDISNQIGKKVTPIYIKSGINRAETNYRQLIATMAKYKGNRGEKAKRFLEFYHCEYWADHNVIVSTEDEADDLIIKHALEHRGNCVIVSRDKDLKQIPGLYYDIGTKELSTIDELQASRNFWWQVVTGDAVDNVPGLYKCVLNIHGITPASLLKNSRYQEKLRDEFDLVKTPHGYLKIVVEQYKKNNIPMRDLLEIVCLLHVGQRPIDFIPFGSEIYREWEGY